MGDCTCARAKGLVKPSADLPKGLGAPLPWTPLPVKEPPGCCKGGGRYRTMLVPEIRRRSVSGFNGIDDAFSKSAMACAVSVLSI